MGGLAFQNGEVEGRYHAFLPVAELPMGRDEAALDEAGRDAELIKEIKGGGVEGRGAKIHRQFVMQFKDRGPDARLAQTCCGDEANRARANDDDPVFGIRHAIPSLSRNAMLAWDCASDIWTYQSKSPPLFASI